jgi:hypothetical protein
MSKIFITGMSAQHASPSSNQKNLNFAGVVSSVIGASGHEVTWASPSVYMTKESLDAYDVVLVGVCPITSVGANRVYGALSVISLLWGSNKLRLFVDGPSQSQIEVSLKSSLSNPQSIVKSFFSYRKEYSNVSSDLDIQSRIMNGIELLLNEDWVTTIVPSLPWTQFEHIKLSKNAKSNLELVNLDAHLIINQPTSNEKAEKWCVDSYSSKWSKSVVSSLTLPHSPMKWSKGWTDEQVMSQVSRSVGAIISPDQRDGTWWSYRYIQALNSNTPIVTDWKDSQSLGFEWTILASSIESMSQQKKDLLATAQKELYVASIDSKKKSTDKLKNILGVK